MKKNPTPHIITRDNPDQISRMTGISGEFRAIVSNTISAFYMFTDLNNFLNFSEASDLDDLLTVDEFISQSSNREQLKKIRPNPSEVAVIDTRTRIINVKLGYFRRLLRMFSKGAKLPEKESEYFLTRRAELLTELTLLNIYIGPSDIGKDAKDKRITESQAAIVHDILGS